MEKSSISSIFIFLRQNSQYIDEDEKKKIDKKKIHTLVGMLKFAGMCALVCALPDGFDDRFSNYSLARHHNAC